MTRTTTWRLLRGWFQDETRDPLTVDPRIAAILEKRAVPTAYGDRPKA